MNFDGRFLIVGRLPPEGRDLDVIARRADATALAERLQAEGFAERGDRWVRFTEAGVEIVDLADADEWGLPEAEVDDLFALAVPHGDGAARPSPVHAVLLEARRWTNGGILTERRRARVAEALAAGDPVWDEVVRRAPAWGVEDALPVLRGEAVVRQAARHARRRLVRPQGRVVTLSGIDGSGKSSQVEALRQALDRLGYPTATVWTRITINPSLDVIAGPVKRIVRVARRGAPSVDAEAATEGRPPGHGASPSDPARAFRLRHPVVNQAWILVVATVNAFAQWRAVAPHLARGRIVVCDRYTLDSATHLRYKYGPAERFRWQVAVIGWLSPTPLRSYLLDVPGAVAHARKPEKYTAAQLEQLAEMYREECVRLGVRRLDGRRPAHELAAEIGDDVLRALTGRQNRRNRRTKA